MKIAKPKQTHRCRDQTSDYQLGEKGQRSEIGVED